MRVRVAHLIWFFFPLCDARLRSLDRPQHEATTAIPEPRIESFIQKLDHFNYADARTFQQRYFVHDKEFKAGGPMFFYTGNEGPLESFYYNTGLPFDWAAEFGAIIVFAEHRYYGKTLPFGNESFSKENLGFLSITQTLADFARLVSDLKVQLGVSSVVTFGGSYGGVLSAWARMKYPNVFDIALAASAPIPQVMNLVPDTTTFFRLVTEDAQKADPKCPDAVRAGFARIIENAKTEAGLQSISKAFELCKVMDYSELDHFLQYARNAWTEMAMCNYPYPTSFLAPLPAWPIKEACSKVVSASDPMVGLAAATAMPYRDPNATCFDMYKIFVECADQTGCGSGPTSRAWDYQMCTELFYEQATTNTSDMFPPRNWTMERLNEYCHTHYNTAPDQSFSRLHFGGANMTLTASKIIFSNGLLDPWHGGGYMHDQSALLPAVVIDAGAHHLDLRGANEADPQGAIDARNIEKGFVKRWLADGAQLCGAGQQPPPSPPPTPSPTPAPTPPPRPAPTPAPSSGGMEPGGVIAVVFVTAIVSAGISGFLVYQRVAAATRRARLLGNEYPAAGVALQTRSSMA